MDLIFDDMKILNQNELNELILKVNRICFSEDFRKYMTNEFKCTPANLTFDIYYEDETNLVFDLCVKNYGYEHSCNDGTTEFSDPYDFNYGDFYPVDGMEDYAWKYFENNYPEIYRMINYPSI